MNKAWAPYWSHKAAPSSSTEAATVRGFADNSAKLGYIARLHLDWYLQLYASCVKQSKRTVCAIKASPLRLKLSCRPIGWNSQTAILCNGGSIHSYACAQSSIGQRHPRFPGLSHQLCWFETLDGISLPVGPLRVLDSWFPTWSFLR